VTLYAFEGHAPVLASDAWVAPSADIIGQVALGESSSVWFGVVIRADNTLISVGARSNVQENAMLHSDPGVPLTIGEGCTIGHLAILHGCTIGDNSLVGMGATVLNRAVIGENCLIGANALVTEGKVFEPGSLIVGAPAKAIRKLSEEEIAGLRQSAASYVERAVRFRNSMTVVD